MARRDSLCLVGLLLWACDSTPPTTVIQAPEWSVDAAIVDADDMRLLDADLATPVTIETTPIAACDAPTIEIEIISEAPVRVTPVIDDVPRAEVVVAPGTPLTLTVGDLAEGRHTLAFEIAGERLAGPDLTIDRSAPRISWSAADDVCVPAPLDPIVDDLSPVEITQEDGALDCRLARRVRVVDACGFATTARRVWRVGPPGAPVVSGDRALTWAATDACTTAITARLGRVGEAPGEYREGAIIEWPGDYELELTAEGCNGPAIHVAPVSVPAGPCDRPTRPIDTAPNVRGWLEITSQRLVDLSLELTGRALAAAAPVRDAATLLARHPAFPNACPARDECLIGADWRAVLDALSQASDSLAGIADARSARRCVVEAGRVVVAAGVHAPSACAAPDQAAALVDAWRDPAARARLRCLCSGVCDPTPDCVDALVLERSSDPIEFNRQIVAIAGLEALACLNDPGCAALPELVARLRAALEAGDCAARGLMSVVVLLVGRHCAGVGRFRHPGTDALAAASGRWPLGQAGVAATLADLDQALAACVPDADL